MPKASIWRIIVAVSVAASFSAQAEVSLRESVNSVQFCDGVGQTATAVTSGAVLVQPGVIETGAEGLAEITSAKATVRLGARTMLRVRQGDKLDLVRGNLLFEGLSKHDSLSVLLGSSMAEIFGEAGFVQCKESSEAGFSSLTIGSMVGTTVVQFKGKTYTIKGAEFVSLGSVGVVGRGYFDLEKQIGESRLVNGFSTPLARMPKMQKATRQFAQMRKRGFVQQADSSLLLGQLEQNGTLLAGVPTFKEKAFGFGVPAASTMPTLTVNGSAPPSLPNAGNNGSVSMIFSLVSIQGSVHEPIRILAREGLQIPEAPYHGQITPIPAVLGGNFDYSTTILLQHANPNRPMPPLPPMPATSPGSPPTPGH